MKFNILIIGSSDLESIDKSDVNNTIINTEKDVLESKLPCENFILGQNKKCKTCNLINYEHKIGYQALPLKPTDIKYTNPDGSVIMFKTHFSDFWKEKYEIFSKIKSMINDKQLVKDFEIIYETADPLYKFNKKYIPVINKINNNISKKLGFKSIKPGKTHLYNNILSKLNINNKYDMILVLSAGPGWLITPKNVKIIYNLLNENGLLCHMYNKSFYKNKFEADIQKMEFNSFLSMCIPQYKNELSDDDKKCIQNYSKMLLSNKFSYFDNGILKKRQ